MQIFYVLGAWGISDVRNGHCPLKVHGPDATLPQEIQELGGGLELLGISRVGRSPVLSSLECGGCSAGKSSGEGARVLGVGWHL